MATTRKISLKEVEKHKSKNDVWIVLHNDVLDVTSFLAEHPGGDRVIMDLAGQDASVAFEDVGHSHDARELAAQYKIGWLPPSERRRFVDSCCSGTSKEKGKKDVKKGKRQSRSLISKKYRKAKPHNLSPRSLPPYEKPKRRKRNEPPPPDGRWKYALLVIAVALIAGFAYKKFAD